MDFLSGLFGWGKKKEPLVLGAELKCPYGSKHSFLMLPIKEMTNGSLPCGCVKDCKAGVNIFPFGDCEEGVPCGGFMDLADEWENLEPQDMLIDGEEVITTESILMCKKCGVGIEAVTSGQDGVVAAKWMEEAELLYEVEQKYPGLVGIITDAGGSVYLNGDMYKDAINFLEDCIKKNNGEIHIGTLIVPDNLESNMIRILMDLLLPGCDASRPEGYLTVLEERGVATGMYDTPGWDPHLLNAQMIQMLRVDCEQTAEKVRTDPVARFPEEHKKGMRAFSELVMGIGYGLVIYYATTPEDTLEKAREAKAKWSAKLKASKKCGKSESGKYSGDLMSAEEATRYSEHWRKLGIGSDNTWRAFKDANPNGTIDDYFEIVQKQSPWPLGQTGTPTILKAGDRFFMAVENNTPENIIGGFGVKERIESTEFVRNNLAVKYDWKTSCNVIREFEVNSGIELNVNAGPVGPQIDLGADLYLKGDTTITQYDLFSNLGSGIKREDYVHIVDEYWVD